MSAENQHWCLVNYKEAKSGREYEIVNQDRILRIGKNKNIKPGNEVNVTCGSALMKATIITVADSYETLYMRFKMLFNIYVERQESEIIAKYIKEIADLTREKDSYKQIVDTIRSNMESFVIKSNVNTIEENGNIYVNLGKNNNKILYEDYEALNWKSTTQPTKHLLGLLFSREHLATHSLTGLASPAFKQDTIKVKKRLNPEIVDDIIEFVESNSSCTRAQIRTTITSKCADENKMYKQRLEKERDSKRRRI
ncbi:PREDICTED: uncharacterized protein LOC108564257 [Nicrophorus vespilloides]|uniref:Uncharacterized protein LOC108564257 n=1 Tax=Nicrophorus vespilloides TaxID=110193 RepID=A0ABM1MVZ1_NICVS|nr:PREDICTED: uncharacterized protein LOC108564257 [Nicrophorus vespilloides]